MISREEFTKSIDHTILKPDTTYEQVKLVCEEAIDYNFASVCILPTFVIYAKDILCGTGVKLCTVIGFPLGSNITPVKLLEMDEAIENGADEVDIVVNNTFMKSKEIERYKDEIALINDIAHSLDVTTKFIIETGILDLEEKILATRIINECGADFVKTSTGFIGGGATLEDVALLKSLCNQKTKVKASGGIRSLDDALKFIEAGASRIGTSSGVQIMKEFDERFLR